MPTKKTEVENDDPTITAPILSSAIIAISSAVQKLSQSDLNRKAIVVLLKHSTGLTQYQIERVLNSLNDLKNDYCRP